MYNLPSMENKKGLQDAIILSLKKIGIPCDFVHLEHPADRTHGDYATNIALSVAKKVGQNPRELAEVLKHDLDQRKIPYVKNISVAGPGFLNFTFTDKFFSSYLESLLNDKEKIAKTARRIMVEFAHPNTHKEMHIGHMRTLITGEALSRILEACGHEIFRANYQGDIGLHVAKAMYGLEVCLKERDLLLSDIDSWSNSEKAHFLGESYARGSNDYDDHKEMVETINKSLYQDMNAYYNSGKSVHNLMHKEIDIHGLDIENPEQFLKYIQTRKWSLDYYDEFYARFGTDFDRLFFESEMSQSGIEIVKRHVGSVFEESEGAIIFRGEDYGLHTRVFVTTTGNPLYEAKDIANAYKQYEAFQFDQNIHVVANEQAGYFQVVFKALELIDPEKFKGKEKHLSMGMVNLVGRKMSSRTGDVLTVDSLLDEVKSGVEGLMTDEKITSEEKATISEQITIGAVKYSVLKVSATQDVSFDIQKSISLDGDSGPYIQYTYARTQSVLRKGKESSLPLTLNSLPLLQPEELNLLKTLARFPEVVEEAGEKLSPSILCTYIFDLAQEFNLFYQKLPILKEKEDIKAFRLALTEGVGKTLKRSLRLLAIDAPERM